MATSVAFAADLPSKKAAASAGSVQVCKVAGKTGFTLPGSDTCVVVSGYVWAEVNATGSGTGFLDTSSNPSNYSTKLREQLNIDALSNTEMGVLASHASFRFNQYGASNDAEGNAGHSSGAAIDSAYIQLGGLKVGYFDSTFGMMDGSPSIEGPNNSPSTTSMQIGYSAKLGNGVTLGVALEDVVSNWGYDYSEAGAAKIPDVVGTLDFSMANADIHLGAVYHDINTGGDVGNSSTYDSTGYAFDAGATFKLDSLAKGDALSLEYTYVDGDTARLSGHIGSVADSGGLIGMSEYSVNSDSPWGNKATGSSYAASFHHVFSANLSGNVFGGYQDFVASTVLDGDLKIDSTLIGANLDYQPVKGFHVQPEVYHVSQNISYAEDSSHDISGSYTGAVLRIKRDF
jgi:hypothetical protein